MPFTMWGAGAAKVKAAEAMGRAASAVGGAATQFSRNLASITKEQWKEGKGMFQAIRDIDWDKPKAFFNQFYQFMSQFGIISEFIMPLMDLFDILDAAIIMENVDAITAWNESLSKLHPMIRDVVGAIFDWGKSSRMLKGWMDDFGQAMLTLGEDVVERIEEVNEVMERFGKNWGTILTGKGRGRRKPPKIIGGELIGLG